MSQIVSKVKILIKLLILNNLNFLGFKSIVTIVYRTTLFCIPSQHRIQGAHWIKAPSFSLFVGVLKKYYNVLTSYFACSCPFSQHHLLKILSLEHSLTSYTKIYSKWIRDLNVRPDPMRHFEENTGRIFDINPQQYLFQSISQSDGNKNKKQVGHN